MNTDNKRTEDWSEGIPGRPPPRKPRLGMWLIGGGTAAAVVLAGAAYGQSAGWHLPWTNTAAATAAKPTVTPTAKPTHKHHRHHHHARKIVVVPAPAAQPAEAPAQAPASNPELTNGTAVVLQFYADINAKDFAGAWALGGDNIGGSDYNGWVHGYDTTVAVNVDAYGTYDDGTVWTHLSTDESDGSHKSFDGSYTVSGGVITSANMTQTG
jgi:hypothetical protein